MENVRTPHATRHAYTIDEFRYYAGQWHAERAARHPDDNWNVQRYSLLWACDWYDRLDKPLPPHVQATLNIHGGRDSVRGFCEEDVREAYAFFKDREGFPVEAWRGRHGLLQETN